MPKPAIRPYSRYSRDAALLLGQLIRRARLERKITTTELAERAGLSRGLVQRIEQGDPGCAIGAVFEAAAIVGVRQWTLGLWERGAHQPRASLHPAIYRFLE